MLGAIVLHIPGLGRFTWADGRQHTGSFKEGRPHGAGHSTKLDKLFQQLEVTRLNRLRSGYTICLQWEYVLLELR